MPATGQGVRLTRPWAMPALTATVVLIALAARQTLIADAGLDGLHAYDVSGLFVLSIAMLPVDTGRDFPAGALRPSVADRSCVVSDDPTVLAILGVLSRDLRRGCPLLVDVTGLTYDRYAMTGPDGRAVPRPQNERWQGAILDHLTSGCAVVVPREDETGRTPATRRRIVAVPVLARAADDSVRSAPGCSSGGLPRGTAHGDAGTDW